MKKILFILTVATFLVLPQSIIYAEDGVKTRSAVKERIQTRIEEVKSNILERKEERAENRQERRDERTENHASRLSNRFEIYYDRLSKIITKVEERIGIIKESGKDVTSAESKLAEAKSKLEEAKTSGQESVDLFNSIEAENYESQKATAIEARDKANLARKSFIEVSKLTKESVRVARSL